MPVIQGGGISYDRGAGARESMGQLAQSLAQARATANAEQATKLQGQRDALTRYTTLMDEMGKVAQAANIPLSAFIRTQAGSNYLNQMFQEYSQATGKQLSSDEALKMSTDVIELINNPDYMDRFTSDWFTAQYRSPSGQAVAAQPKAPAAEVPPTQGAAQGAQGAAQGAQVAPAAIQPQVGGAPVVPAAQSNAQPMAVTPSGVAVPTVTDIGAAAVAFYNSKNPNEPLAGAPEAQIARAVDFIQRNNLGETFTAWAAQNGVNVPSVQAPAASAPAAPAPSAPGTIAGIPIPPSVTAVAPPGTGPIFNPTQTAPQAAPQTTPQPSQAAPRVYGQNPPKGAAQGQVQDYYSKEFYKSEHDGAEPASSEEAFNYARQNATRFMKFKETATGVKPTSSLTVPGSKLPVSMSEDEIASTFPNTPKFVSSVLVRNIRESESPLDAMAKAMTSQKTGQALLNSNVQPVEKEPVVAPPKVAQAVSDMGQLVVKGTSGTPLTYKEQMLLRQKAAVAGNWVNTTWKGMSD